MNSQLNRDSSPSQNGAAAVAKGRQPATERVILLRGVVWQGQDVDAFKLWQDLMRFWPTAFAKEHTEPAGILLAHAGQPSEFAVSRGWVQVWAAGFISEVATCTPGPLCRRRPAQSSQGSLPGQQQAHAKPVQCW